MIVIKKTIQGFLINNDKANWSSACLASKFGEFKLATTTNTIEIPIQLLDRTIKGQVGIFSVMVKNHGNEADFEALSVGNQRVEFLGNADYPSDSLLYICYVSQQGMIRLLNDGGVSSKSYYLDHDVQSMRVDNGDTLKLLISLTTKYVRAKKVHLMVTKRESGEIFSPVLTSKIKTITKEGTVTKSLFEVEMSIKQLLQFVARELNLDMHYWDALDLSFSFEIEEHTLIPYFRRLKFASGKVESIKSCVQFNEEKDCLLEIFSTPYGNTSMKYQVIDRDVLDCLEQLSGSTSTKIKTKKVMLIGEYPHKAQDTGLALFKSIVENHSSEIDAFYLISKESKDLKNLEGYEDKVIWYRTKEHVEKFFEADIYSHSHSLIYLFPVVNEKTLNKSMQAKRVFIQHGIIGKRNLLSLYGYNEGKFTDFIVCSSERERKIIETELLYPAENIIFSGLSRFDKLLTPPKGLLKRLITKRTIKKTLLIAPTWRKELLKVEDEAFKESLFYKRFNSLLTNKTLQNYCEKKDISVKFYLHSNFQKRSHLFRSEFAEVVLEGSQTVQSLIKEAGLLVTDFSSLALDFALLERPILYYDFETPDDLREESDGFLPGEIVGDETLLVQTIMANFKHLKMKDEYKMKLDDLYYYRDQGAVERYVRFLLKDAEE